MSAVELRQPADQRQGERYPFRRPATGRFILETPAGSHPIGTIKDISSTGMRVYLDASLAAGLKVVVVYLGPQIKAEVNGMVVWCQERTLEPGQTWDPGRWMLGIQLLSPVLLMAMSGLC